MYRELVEQKHWLLFFATYRISQDHLEIMFGKIRSMNGCNENPLPHQFQSAYRKILHQCETTHSPYANIRAMAVANATSLITSNILSVPSTRKRRSNLMEDVELLAQHPNEPSASIIDDVDTPFEKHMNLNLSMIIIF